MRRGLAYRRHRQPREPWERGSPRHPPGLGSRGAVESPSVPPHPGVPGGGAPRSQPGPAATHRWPDTPASKDTGVSAAPPARPRLPTPHPPVLTKLAKTRRRVTAAPVPGSRSSSTAAAANSSGRPMAEPPLPAPPRAGPAAFLRRHVRPRRPPSRCQAALPEAQTRVGAWRELYFHRATHRARRGGQQGLPTARESPAPPGMRAQSRGAAQTRTLVPVDPHPPELRQRGPTGPGCGAPALHRAHPFPAYFFFFSCVLVNQESSSFLL